VSVTSVVADTDAAQDREIPAMPKGTRRSLWGWTGPVRYVLTGLALVAALTLGWVSHSVVGDSAPAATLLIDPNTAPPGVLSALPRLGPVLTGRIVEERERRSFTGPDDLDVRVKGIGPATIAAIRPFLRFEPRATGADEPRFPTIASRSRFGSTAP
jgi:competence protein ComEA